MAIQSIVKLGKLEKDLILVPERYDPRRAGSVVGHMTVGDLVEFARAIVLPKRDRAAGDYLVLDTGDAQEGFIVPRRSAVPLESIGSAKKSIRNGDVIVSRLRPYLRQVAFVDAGLFVDNFVVLCSTEFYVLRPKENNSIAFLVPFLLTGDIQGVLAASQEGGHHPRFNEGTLQNIVIPDHVLKKRRELSALVEKAALQARKVRQIMADLITRCSKESVST